MTTLRWSGVAFLYWLTCMAALEPGNLARMPAGWATQHWEWEVVRLLAAGFLGASATPVLRMLAARFPIRNFGAAGAFLVNLVVVLALALGLVLLSCALAVWWGLPGGASPSSAYVVGEVYAHTLLVAVYLAGFLAAIHTVRRFADTPQSEPQQQPGAPQWLTVLPVKDRGRLTLLDLRSVDWIETQGNYQALHAQGAVHLVRETSTRLFARLDPTRFARIHRQSIVALDRVRRLEPLSNGDATVWLSSGAELRVTRRHREALRRRLEPRTLDPA